MLEFKPVVVSRYSSLDERKLALQQIYHQVLGRQPYASERKILAKLEVDFLKDKIGVRRFLKALGGSEIYLNSFYHNCSNLKFLELCFKHFLGRAPRDRDEVHLYCNILMTKGVGAVVTALLDSEEYRKEFGCFTVPYPRELKYYESPKAYLETRILNEEQIAQRGMIVPTMYWHELGLNCEAGVCHHPEANEVLETPVSQEGEALQEQLQELLKLFDTEQARQALATLSPQEKEKLRRVIH